MNSRYRIKIAPHNALPGPEGACPRYFYTISDGLNGPIIKNGSSCSVKGWMGAWHAAEKTIKRLMLKEKPHISHKQSNRMVKATNERVQFRLIHMECCGQLLCWVNPRFPTHCPECGVTVYPQVRGWVTISDPNAHLRFSTEGTRI